jgi:hypothetical protein
MQHASTSEGCHTNDWPCSIYEGAGANTKYFPQKLVTRRLLEHVNCQPGNCIGHQSLAKLTFPQRRGTPSYGQGNGRHGTYERPRPPAPFEEEALVMKLAHSSKASVTFKAPTHVSSLNSRTYPRTYKSHMAKLSATIRLTKKKKNESG